MRNLLRSEQPGTVLAGAKAGPCGWPPDSLDPSCGRSQRRPTKRAERRTDRSTRLKSLRFEGIAAIGAGSVCLWHSLTASSGGGAAMSELRTAFADAPGHAERLTLIQAVGPRDDLPELLDRFTRTLGRAAPAVNDRCG